MAIISCDEKVNIETEKANIQLVLNQYVKAWESLDAEGI